MSFFNTFSLKNTKKVKKILQKTHISLEKWTSRCYIISIERDTGFLSVVMRQRVKKMIDRKAYNAGYNAAARNIQKVTGAEIAAIAAYTLSVAVLSAQVFCVFFN